MILTAALARLLPHPPSVAGIPFFRNSLGGDLFYSALLFGIFALAKTRFALPRNPVPAGAA